MDCFAALAMTLLGCLKIEYVTRDALHFVPAKAGTHNHRYFLVGRLSLQLDQIATAVVMGPGLRRDDN
jgi:hypothetical protein